MNMINKWFNQLKNLFIKDNYTNAFDVELKKLLKEISPEEVPSNFTTFYFNYLESLYNSLSN